MTTIEEIKTWPSIGSVQWTNSEIRLLLDAIAQRDKDAEKLKIQVTNLQAAVDSIGRHSNTILAQRDTAIEALERAHSVLKWAAACGTLPSSGDGTPAAYILGGCLGEILSALAAAKGDK